MYYMTKYPSPAGMITLACENKCDNLVGLWFDGQKYYGANLSDKMSVNDDLPIFAAVKNWLDRYFNGEKPDISELSLSPIGSEFRQKVWKILCDILYGEVITYGDIAKKLNMKNMSAQAVGGAVGHNPISIIIPCHRVVGSNGSLTGYAGGIDIKIKLLELEGVDVSRLTIPKKGTAI